ncbi:uncharacterized protein [Fopius arisanus]|uniref:Sperm microtubule inner protein 1 C-terminal domain-containing protein n=1 Tax=Fopius arisanus TaxID=64838 RepID=A0A9R1TIA2_9HYME|nr:PREDICTED: uncharacterized protein LOC105271306 [Fopius arisanus]
MADNKVCDARCQAFRKETIDTEDKLRMKWFTKNRLRLLADLEQEDKHVKDKLKKLKEESALPVSEPEPTTIQEETEIPVSVASREKIGLDLMRSIHSSLLDVLYDKKESSHEARKKYLEERCKLPPEDRFFTMHCTNWSYGWKVKNFQSFSSKEYNRKPLIRTSFYRNNLSSVKNDERPCSKKGLATLARNFQEIQEY